MKGINMYPKDPKIDRIAGEFAEMYQELLKDYSEEAQAQGFCKKTIYDWANPNRSSNLPAYGLIVSTVGDELMEFIRQKRKEHWEGFILNGTMDDEWADMAKLFSIARDKFINRMKYDPAIATALRKKLEQLLAEWKKSTQELPF